MSSFSKEETIVVFSGWIQACCIGLLRITVPCCQRIVFFWRCYFVAIPSLAHGVSCHFAWASPLKVLVFQQLKLC